MSETQVILEMTTYLHEVLELPHPVFGNLPICPFARQARLQGKIHYFVNCFERSALTAFSPLMAAIHRFAQDQRYEVLFLIHPDRQAMSFADLDAFVTQFNEQLQPLHLTAFGGHPDDRFNIQGVRTRREPYINVTIQSIEKLKRASEQLAMTRYYENWTPEALKAVGHPR